MACKCDKELQRHQPQLGDHQEQKQFETLAEWKLKGTKNVKCASWQNSQKEIFGSILLCF